MGQVAMASVKSISVEIYGNENAGVSLACIKGQCCLSFNIFIAFCINRFTFIRHSHSIHAAIHVSFIQDLGVFIFSFTYCRTSSGSTSNHDTVLSIFCKVAILAEMGCVVVAWEAVKAQRICRGLRLICRWCRLFCRWRRPIRIQHRFGHRCNCTYGR